MSDEKEEVEAPKVEPDKAIADTKKPSKNVIRHLWDGDAGLAFSYWVVFFIGSMVLSGVEEFFPDKWIAPDAIGTTIVGYRSVAIVYVVFSMVCVWRSANKYRGPKIWPILAKVFVVLGVLEGAFVLAMGIFLVS